LRQRFSHKWVRAIVLGWLALAAITSVWSAEEAVREYVDEITAVSITVPVNAIVFARERTDLAVNARDYVTLAPLEVNRTGKRSYFWSGYVWSTIDRRGGGPVLDPKDELVLIADGRPIPLRADGKSLRDHGVGQAPTGAPIRKATPVLFAARPDEIAYVAHAQELRVDVIHEGVSEPFLLWKDARDGVRELSERLQLER
jgi:hypothetical protein